MNITKSNPEEVLRQTEAKYFIITFNHVTHGKLYWQGNGFGTMTTSHPKDNPFIERAKVIEEFNNASGKARDEKYQGELKLIALI